MASEREIRREQRRMKRKEKKLNSMNTNSQGADMEDSRLSLDNAVGSPTFQGVDELAEMDDWGSAWQEVKEKGENWGGRGKGGRGIQRNTWQPKDIFVEGVTLAYHGTELLERTTIRLGHGRRYGLIGSNGVGKTTLLRRIAAGAVPGWPLHMRSYLVQQEEMVGNASRSALETVMASDTRLAALQREAETLEADAESSGAMSRQSSANTEPVPPSNGNVTEPPQPPQPPPSSSSGSGSAKKDKDGKDEMSTLTMEEKMARLEEIYEELDILDAHDADTRATNILKGLGFSAARISCPTAELSGGWMTRVSLACAIFSRPDLLLLDEPTNHLDLEGVVWLSKRLMEDMGDTTVLMVSHDAAFLDSVATDIIHFRLKHLSYYPGNYSAFLKTKADQDLAANRTQDNLDRQRKHMEESVKKMTKAASGKGGDQKKLGQAASRTKKLERHGFEKDPHGHRFRAQQTFTKFGISIRAGSANELAYRGGKTSRRSLAAHVEKETIFKFPDVTPLACGADAPLVQCRDMSFSFSPPSASQGASKPKGISHLGSKKHTSPPLTSRKLAGAPVRGKITICAKTASASSKASPSSSATSGSTNLLEGVTLNLTLQSRIILVGRNGSGKSTLLRLIASATGIAQAAAGGAGPNTNTGAIPDESPSKEMILEPTGGSIVRHHNARVGLFTQLHTEKLRMSESPLQHMQRLFGGVQGNDEPELRRQLGCCGISGSLALQEMRTLSGGQKSRVVLAELMMRRPHILLLDEPTNHLDLASIDALKSALQGYGGGMVLASHDQALISDILNTPSETDGDLGDGVPRGELWEVKARRVRRREGGIEEYLEEVQQLADNRENRRKTATGGGGGKKGR